MAIQIEMELHKVHKSSISFEPVEDAGTDEALLSEGSLLGRIYVPKATLRALGYESGDHLIVSLDVAES